MQPSINENIVRKINHMIAKAGIPKVRLAQALKVSHTAVTKWTKTGNVSIENLMQLAKYFGTSIEYWTTDSDVESESPRSISYNDDIVDIEGFNVGNIKIYKDDLIIPQYDASASMGAGVTLREQPGIIRSFHVDADWVRQNIKFCTSPKNLCLVTGFGDSMEPLFKSGDPLIIDTGMNAVDHDGVFFFRVGTEGYVKRLQRIPSKDGLIIEVQSENSQYRTWSIMEGMDFEVFGKVLKVWTGKDL